MLIESLHSWRAYEQVVACARIRNTSQHDFDTGVFYARVLCSSKRCKTGRRTAENARCEYTHTHTFVVRKEKVYLICVCACWQDWAFLSRFCFISGRGRFEYLIEFERRYGEPQLLLYYDDVSQWPSVYKTKTVCGRYCFRHVE